jgi:hypothetical protein
MHSFRLSADGITCSHSHLKQHLVIPAFLQHVVLDPAKALCTSGYFAALLVYVHMGYMPFGPVQSKSWLWILQSMVLNDILPACIQSACQLGNICQLGMQLMLQLHAS